MPINITYGGGAGNDILQAAHDLAAQNMQRYSQNLEYAHNLSSSFLGGMEMGQKGAERRETAAANTNKATALAAQNQAELSLKQKQLQVDAAKAGPAAMKAIGMQVPGELPDYATDGPPEIQPPPGVNLPTTLQPEVPKIAPVQPGVGGLPGQYVSAGSTNQDQQQPVSTHVGAMNVMENTISDIEGAAANTKLSAAGQQKYNAWASDIRAIQKQKNDYRPEQYNQVLSQALDKFRGTLGGTKWKNYTIPEPTPAEIFAKTVHTDENGNMFSITKDQHGNPRVDRIPGSVLPAEQHFEQNSIRRDGVTWVRDSKGDWKPHMPKSDEEKDSYDSEKSLSENFAKNYDKNYEKADNQLKSEYEGDGTYKSDPKKIRERMDQLHNDKIMHILGRSHDETKTIREIEEAIKQQNQGRTAGHTNPINRIFQPGGFPPNVSDQTPAAQPAPAQPTAPLMDRTGAPAEPGHTPLAMMGGLLRPKPPTVPQERAAPAPVPGSEIVNAVGGLLHNAMHSTVADREAPLDKIHEQVATKPPTQSIAQPIQTPGRQLPAAVKVNPVLAQAAINSLPKVNTKAEYDKLKKEGSGIKFLDPDGNVRTTP